MRTGRLIWGLLIVIVGVILLAASLDWISWHFLLSLLQLCSHIVGDIEVSSVETGVHRIEALVANPLPVDMKLIQSGCGNIDSCRSNLLVRLKLFAKIGCRLVMNISAVTDPATMPVSGMHHPRFEGVHCRDACTILLIPQDHLPVIFGKGPECGSFIRNQLFIRINPTSIPEIAVSSGIFLSIKGFSDCSFFLSCMAWIKDKRR